MQKLADAGTEPRWCRTCDELIYRSGNRWFSSRVRLGPVFEWSQPRLIVQTQFNDSPGPSWALSPDGQRILLAKRKQEFPRTKLHVVSQMAAGLAEREVGTSSSASPRTSADSVSSRVLRTSIS